MIYLTLREANEDAKAQEINDEVVVVDVKVEVRNQNSIQSQTRFELVKPRLDVSVSGQEIAVVDVVVEVAVIFIPLFDPILIQVEPGNLKATDFRIGQEYLTLLAQGFDGLFKTHDLLLVKRRQNTVLRALVEFV